MINKVRMVISLFFLAILFGCTENADKTKWDEIGEAGGKDRLLTAEYLIKAHKLIGLTNKQMLQLLGPPEKDKTATWYDLEEKGQYIRPYPVLTIKFNKDSVIIEAFIEAWNKISP
jgi:hypothetical protein